MHLLCVLVAADVHQRGSTLFFLLVWTQKNPPHCPFAACEDWQWGGLNPNRSLDRLSIIF